MGVKPGGKFKGARWTEGFPEQGAEENICTKDGRFYRMLKETVWWRAS